MSVSPGDVYQAVVTGEVFGQFVRHVRTWYVDTLSAPIANDVAFMDALLEDTVLGGPHDKLTKYLLCLSSSYTALTYAVQKVSPTRWAKRIMNLPALTVGDRPATNTANLQAAITVAGALASRKQVATYKIGPMATSDCIAGEVGAALKTILGNYADTFKLPLGITIGGATAVLVPAIYHAGTKDPFVPGTADQISTAVVQYQVRVKSTRTLDRGE